VSEERPSNVINLMDALRRSARGGARHANARRKSTGGRKRAAASRKKVRRTG
jgi:non-homologous end joining protein Ku